MVTHRFTPYLVVVGLIALLSVCYIGYKEYQKHVEFEAFMSKVRPTVDKETNPPEQMASVSQDTDTNVPVVPAGHQIDLSVPPLQATVVSEAVQAEAKPLDWSELSPELKARLKARDEKIKNASMKLQRVQTPNGNVHFVELPDIYPEGTTIMVPEGMASQPTFPPTGSFPEVVSVRKSEIPEGEDVEEFLYKK